MNNDLNIINPLKVLIIRHLDTSLRMFVDTTSSKNVLENIPLSFVAIR